MNYKFLVLTTIMLSGCQSVVKDVFEIAATPEELAAMPAIDVCKHLGYSQWRNQPEAYLDAKKEAVKRIQAKEVSADDCVVFAQMAVRSKQRSSEQLQRQMQDLDRMMNDTKSN